MIRWGNRGEDVRYAQDRLNAHGSEPQLAADAIFGPLTNKSTRHYQRTHGLSVDGIIGPRTWASLDGPTVIGEDHGSGGPLTGKTGGKTIEYDTTAHTITPPSPGTKLTTIQAAIKAKQDAKPDPDLGPTVHVKGATKGTAEEIYVWNVLLQLGRRDRWGSEVDVVTPVGPAPKSGGNPPVGKITLRIDLKGNATAELLEHGPVAPVGAAKTRAEAEKSLKADFGFAAVKDGSATWTVEELNKVHAALTRLPAADRSALAGVDLVRDRTLSDEAGNALAGKFHWELQPGVSGGKPTRAESLRLADLAFAGDDVSFIGGTGTAAPASFHTILHEAAHAVETKQRRDATFDRLQAESEHGGKVTTFNARVQDVNSTVNDFNADNKTAAAAAKKYPPADKTASKSYRAAVVAVTKALNSATKNRATAQHAPLEKRAADAIAARNTKRAALQQANAKNPALADFAPVDKRQDAWFEAVKKMTAAHTDMKTTEAAVTAAKKKETAAESKTAGSKRAERFVTFVTQHKIAPFTEYARSKWPSEPGEFFAEAYALWLNDREYLDSVAPALGPWFDQGRHR